MCDMRAPAPAYFLSPETQPPSSARYILSFVRSTYLKCSHHSLTAVSSIHCKITVIYYTMDMCIYLSPVSAAPLCVVPTNHFYFVLLFLSSFWRSRVLRWQRWRCWRLVVVPSADGASSSRRCNRRSG